MKQKNFDIAFHDAAEWRVNGKPVAAAVREYLEERASFEIEDWGENNCPYCNSPLPTRHFHDVAEDNDQWHNDRIYISRRCRHCAYWEFNGVEGGNKCMDHQKTIFISSISARFKENLPDACAEEMAQYLRRNPDHWHQIEPTRLERLVADIFKANYHASEVIHVGKPCDQGVDVVFIESNDRKWLIQVKRRADPKKPEGFSTLQSILGTLALKGVKHGIIVSTADVFSYYAKKAQKQAEQQGFVVRMIDKGILDRMIEPLLPQTPWQAIFQTTELAYISKDVKRRFWGPECEGQLRLF